MIQFTTISGMKIPRLSFRLGIYACNTNCTIVTNEAMITMYAGIRTLSGISFRSREIMKLLIVRITIVVSPMPSPLIAEDVTASVGHIPSIWTKVGFSVIIPFFKRSAIFPILLCTSCCQESNCTKCRIDCICHCRCGNRRTGQCIDFTVLCRTSLCILKLIYLLTNKL